MGLRLNEVGKMPIKKDEKDLRKRHNITLPDSAWQYLNYLKKIHPAVKSRCGAIEYLIDFYVKRQIK